MNSDQGTATVQFLVDGKSVVIPLDKIKLKEHG